VASRWPGRPTASSLGSAFLDLAFGLGPVTIGAVVASSGYGAAFLTGAGVALVGVLVLVIGTRPQSPSARKASTSLS